MKKTASQIANQVLAKIAEKEKNLPGYLALRGSPLEAATDAAPLAALMSAPLGAMAAGFSPEIARKIPGDTARIIAGLLGGAILGGGGGGGLAAIIQSLANKRSIQLEKQLREQGQI